MYKQVKLTPMVFMSNFRFFIIAVMLMALTGTVTYAQLPDCASDSGLVFSLSGSQVTNKASRIYNWNPYLPLSATNPWANTINPDSNSVGLAVSENLNSTTGPSPTFYAVNLDAMYYYYNGTAWVNTGHSAGGGAVNIGAGGGYIYSMNGLTGTIYRYDGTGNATMLTSITDFNSDGPYDLVADCEGNFYVMKCGSPGWLRKYNASGTMIYQWSVTGAPSTGPGYGLAINGNLLMLYTNKLYQGTINPTTTLITVSPLTGNFPASFDFASCQVGGIIKPANDTIFNCKPGTAVSIRAKGIAPYSHTVVSGAATVSGNGPVYQVAATGMTTVVLHSRKNPLYCGTGFIHDTFRIVPPPVPDAGPDTTLNVCGEVDTFTLHGQLMQTQPWVNYTITWTPAANMYSGANTLNPVIHPPAGATWFRLTVATNAGQGECTLSDSVKIQAVDKSVQAGYTFRVAPACTADTLYFTNTTTAGASVAWNFGDGHTDSVHNPVHVFAPQDIYTVNLAAHNEYCYDSVSQQIDTRHPLIAAFGLVKDTLCLDSLATFVNRSTVSLQPASFYWDFDDGSGATDAAPTHRYNAGGTYRVMLVAKDSLACADTAYTYVTVDSVPALEVVADPHILCVGQELRWTPRYIGMGNTGIVWNFGDQDSVLNPRQMVHTYDRAGRYVVRLRASYRACADRAWIDSVDVYAPPVVYIGPDTAICFRGTAIMLRNTIAGAVGEHYLWNTGDTAATLKVAGPGHYSLKVTNAQGCVTADDIEVRKDCYVDIPNAFTPDGDGINDYFFPRQLFSRGVTDFNMQVFNRWGQLIYKTTETSGRGWDGRFNGAMQPAGVYMYLVDVRFNDGHVEQYEGNVTLIY